MKKSYFSLSIILLFIATSFFAQEQEVYDQIFYLNGDKFEVVIKKISQKQIEYIFPNEEFLNIVDKAEIEKIVFKSGRTQNINKRKEPVKKIVRPIERNKIAILPVPFIRSEDGYIESDQKARLGQQKVFNFLQKKLSNIYPRTLQSTRETNSLLEKAGVELKNLDVMPIQELQEILGVQYLIISKIDYLLEVKKLVRKSNSGEEKVDKKGEISYDNDTLETSREDVDYKFTVYLNIYDGDINIYNKNREPFFSFKNSWEDSMEYMLKRVPLYNR